jgi:hypothetical protein
MFDVYAKDNVDEVVDNFLVKYHLGKDISTLMKKKIVETRNGMDILDKRYITCMSIRILMYTMEEDMGYGIRNKEHWCLINVWRAD